MCSKQSFLHVVPVRFHSRASLRPVSLRGVLRMIRRFPEAYLPCVPKTVDHPPFFHMGTAEQEKFPDSLDIGCQYYG